MPEIIAREDGQYPTLLIKRPGKVAPGRLCTIGSPGLINSSKTALFCSKKCPGDAILKAMDQAQRWRDEGRCVISGFHSPIEKECLRILLRGIQPIIICPARSLEGMRVPKEWREGIGTGRILLLSPFEPSQRRLTTELSEQRNRLVAALADEVYFAHMAPGGKTARLAEQISAWHIPESSPLSPPPYLEISAMDYRSNKICDEGFGNIFEYFESTFPASRECLPIFQTRLRDQIQFGQQSCREDNRKKVRLKR